ncbi:MAG: GNAT family N-acetyltransferase [Acidobacteriota bacterium]|nr:GNAT family N-acetyltransferase [Acidobacteriota bacterium]
MPAENLRELRPSDLPDALELSRLAGWNQTSDDWELLLRLDPRGCFGIEVDDRVVATTTLLRYGQQLAWIGMVLTKPDYRRMGFARRLMQAALERSASLKIDSVKLDATADGQPLYEKLGFTTEQIVERWFRDPDRNQEGERRSPSASPPTVSKEMDREAFGADRAEVLRELAKRNPSVATPEGYSFARPGSRSRYLGPCVAADQQTARTVIEQTLRAYSGSSWYWDILATNEKAIELAQEFGFIRQRRLERMVFGGRITTNDQLVYAIAGFELG